MKKVKFIYNPFSGDKQILNYLDYIIAAYQQKNLLIIPYRLSFSVKLELAFDDIDETYDHVLISGGDGTVNQVVNIMKERSIDIPIGVIPAGTANDFAHLIGMPRNIRYAVDMILHSDVKTIDLGYVNGKYFINVFSCGLFTDVSQKTPTEYKNTFGKVAYYITGIKEIPNFKMLNLTMSSRDFVFQGESILFLVFNGRTAGSIELAPFSSAEDGLLDVIIITREKFIKNISTIPWLLMKKNEPYPSWIKRYKTEEIIIDIENGSYVTDVDGEPGPDFPVKISCKKNSLKVLGWI